MIIELMCAPVFNMIRAILSIIPILTFVPNSLAETITLLIKGMQFFPFDVWFICMSSFVFWGTVHIIYAFISFILKFIPIVNIG